MAAGHTGSSRPDPTHPRTSSFRTKDGHSFKRSCRKNRHGRHKCGPNIHHNFGLLHRRCSSFRLRRSRGPEPKPRYLPCRISGYTSPHVLRLPQRFCSICWNVFSLQFMTRHDLGWGSNPAHAGQSYHAIVAPLHLVHKAKSTWKYTVEFD